MQGRRLKKKPEAYWMGMRRGIFRTENNADACRSFTAVERHDSDRFLGT
jgi:hypothetical protein